MNLTQPSFVVLTKQELEELINSSINAALEKSFNQQKSVWACDNLETLTREEAAKILKVSPQTLSNHVLNGEVKATLIGKKYVFQQKEIIKLLNKGL